MDKSRGGRGSLPAWSGPGTARKAAPILILAHAAAVHQRAWTLLAGLDLVVSAADPYLSVVFFLQYSQKALYNQLCFYRSIFDWEAAFSKLQGDEKSKTAHALLLSTHIPGILWSSHLELLS